MPVALCLISGRGRRDVGVRAPPALPVARLGCSSPFCSLEARYLPSLPFDVSAGPAASDDGAHLLAFFAQYSQELRLFFQARNEHVLDCGIAFIRRSPFRLGSSDIYRERRRYTSRTKPHKMYRRRAHR